VCMVKILLFNIFFFFFKNLIMLFFEDMVSENIFVLVVCACIGHSL
jgi:hypothetical protein